MERGKSDTENRMCQECGMVLDRVGEFHPYVFCVLKKAGRDPWLEIGLLAAQLQLKPELPARPPLVRNLPR